MSGFAPIVLEYGFRQAFRVPASKAFAWATDFTPGDWELGGVSGRREVIRLGDFVTLLRDSVPDPSGSSEVKERIVNIYPSERAWTSTHVSGPRLYSQFRYMMRAAGGRTSYLQFRGRELRWERRRWSQQRRAALARTLAQEDRELWNHFARAMERELGSG